MADINYVKIGGIPTARLSRRELANLLLAKSVKHSRKGSSLLFDVNGHGLALALFDKKYHDNLLKADVIHADGEPMVTASRLLTDTPVPERSATTDMFHDVAEMAQHEGKTFYLLGGQQETVDECARIMREQYPALKIVGARNGYFTQEQEAEVCEAINRSGADIVWVGLGKPKEQDFCVRNRDRINAGWLVTCGGCFNYVTGHYPRAPLWMQRYSLEWLHRLATQPRKLGWRYLTTTPVALYLLFTRTSAMKPANALT